MTAAKPEGAGVVRQILEQVIVGNKLTPPSDSLTLDIDGITYRVCVKENNGYFSARLTTEQRSPTRRRLRLAPYDIKIKEHQTGGRLLSDILNIHRHAADGNKNVLTELISKNINPDIKDADGSTPLILAAANGHTEIVDRLLQFGADVNAADLIGRTPLMHAIIKGQTKIVELILKKSKSGIDLNSADSNGLTPLIGAAAFGKTEIVELLLQSGADVNARKNRCDYMLRVAALYGQIETVDLLLRNGADICIFSPNVIKNSCPS